MADKPTILVTRRLPDAVHARLERDYDARLNPEDKLYSKSELIAAAQGADAIMPCHTEHFTDEVFQGLPESVKIIANFSVGYDHVDVSAAKAQGVVVTNTPDVLSDATAETTILLMLGAARRASEGERLVRAGRWKDWSPAFMVGRSVTGKRLGVLGMGRVGQVVADRARGFDMEIHYHNRSPLSPEAEKGATFHATLDELLPHCDFLAVHCNVTDETRGILNSEKFALMPEGAILVNAARGAVIDDDSLVEALTSGKLFAAGIDTYNDEPNVDPRLIALENTFLLPHIGSANEETRDAMGFRALDNLDAFFAGREPGDRVA